MSLKSIGARLDRLLGALPARSGGGPCPGCGPLKAKIAGMTSEQQRRRLEKLLAAASKGRAATEEEAGENEP